VASNWGNWAYVAGFGDDLSKKDDKKDAKQRPDKVTGTVEGRRFNPVNQGFDYNPSCPASMILTSSCNRIKPTKRRDVGVPALRERNPCWIMHPLVQIDYVRSKARN
jgi:hypothetical protein